MRGTTAGIKMRLVPFRMGTLFWFTDLRGASASLPSEPTPQSQAANIITGLFAFRARRSCDSAVCFGSPVLRLPPLFRSVDRGCG